MSQLPILQVLIPLLGAPLCALLRQRRVAWALFLATAAGALVCAVLLTYRVSQGEVLSYALGGWPAPGGIEYVIDAANAPVLALVSAIALVVAVYARASVESEIEAKRIPLFYSCLCLNLAGLLGVTATGDAFNLFVFLEIASLSSYALIAMGRRRRALLAAFRYLIIGTIGATFLLIGIGLAYAVTGTLNMADLAQRLPEVYGNRALTAAVAFVVVGLGVKMAVFPLHSWLPGAYAESPSAVGTFLSSVSTKVALYAFVRFAFSIFGGALVFGLLPVGVIGLAVASVAMLVGSAVAFFQRDLKYLLGWSSIAQIGYIVAGFSLATLDGIAAGYLHLINHAVMKAALFAAAGVLLLRLGSVRLAALSGLGRRMPWTFTAILLAGLGLIGMPPTAGFVSKWALVQALVEQGRWLVVAAVLVSSLLALGYVWRIVEIAWFREPVAAPPLRRVAPSMVAATWVLVVASLYFGVSPGLLAARADNAAAALLGATP
jgi:multicomponent Na+:H+ antiporter subunit D